MQVLFRYLFVLVFTTVHISSARASAVCEQQAYQQTLPKISQERKTATVQNLCFNGFSVGYSHTLKTPLWALEHLTKKRLKRAEKLERTDNFHAESRLPRASRIELRQMRKKGYDRGHLAPHRDMSTANAQYDSFSYANIALQNSKHNRYHWSKIESYTRGLAYKYGEVYVATGVHFPKTKRSQKKNKHGVIIPSHFYKAVYIPKLNKAGVYWSRNDATANTRIISLQQLYQKTGIKLMPQISQNVVNKAYSLPLTAQALEYTNDITNQNLEDNENLIIMLIVVFVKEILAILKDVL